MKESKGRKTRKIIAILIFVFMIIGIIKLIPTFSSLVTEEGRIEFEQKVEDFGILGPVLIGGLEICKIVLIFLPGEPIELLAGMCYGPAWGLIIIYVGVIISNIIIISAVKKYGVNFVKEAVPEDKIEKIKDIVDQHPNKSEATLLLLYFLPALPKDFITYVASLLPIDKSKIMVIAIFGRFPAVFSSVLVGSKVLDGDIKSIILIYLITYIISGLIAMIYKYKFSAEKRKEKN